jgi:DNA-binding NtrC family response regulator
MVEPPSGRSAPRTLTRIIQQADLPLYALDQFGRLRAANPAVSKLVGVPLEELSGIDCSVALPPDGPRSVRVAAWLGWPIGRLSGGPFDLPPLPLDPLEPGLEEPGLAAVDPSASRLWGFCWTLEAERHRFWLCAVQPWENSGGSPRGGERLSPWAGRRAETDPPADPRQVLIAIRSRFRRLDSLGPLIGVSASIRRAMVQTQTAVASQLSIPIWLHGPAGSGKQQVARGLVAGRGEARGGASGDPELVVIHCPLMDVSLLEGVLELYRDRAIAHGRMPGLILQQLDRLTEQPQARLLEFLDQHAPDPLITTSRRPPAELLGGHWQRLLSRLAILTVELPPLADRPEDLPSLCEACLSGRSSAEAAKSSPVGLSEASAQLIGAYPWPGNYRELEQVLAAAAAAAAAESAAVIEPRHLPVAVRTAGSLTSALGDPTWLQPISLDDVLLEVERTLVRRALAAEPRNRTAAARLLGLSRTRLLRRIDQLGLSSSEPEQMSAE